MSVLSRRKIKEKEQKNNVKHIYVSIFRCNLSLKITKENLKITKTL